MDRPDWDYYFLQIAALAATRATCPVRSVGAVLVNPETKAVLGTGYNGAPIGMPHCNEACATREHGEKSENCKAVHAENNTIYMAARHGTNPRGSVLYSTLAPCPRCARALIQVGVQKVVYLHDSAYPEALKELESAGVDVIKWNPASDTRCVHVCVLCGQGACWNR